MILLKKLTLKNFLSHENTIIEFDENEKILLDGASGAGKSSIFDAILWVLYGQGRTDNRSLVRRGAKKGYVSLELTRMDVEFGKTDTVILTREIDRKGKHTLEIAIQSLDGPKTPYPLSGLREAQNWIDKELIGASYLLFINSVAYVQGNSENFVSQTAPKRKELLLEIIKAEDYRKYYEIARQTLAKLKNDENLISGQKIALEASYSVLQGRIGGKEGYIKEIEDINHKLSKLGPQKAQLEDKKESYFGIDKAIGVLVNGIENAAREKGLLEKKITEDALVVANYKEGALNKSAKEKELADTHVAIDNARQLLSDANLQENTRNEVLSRRPVVHDNNFTEIERLKNNIKKFSLQPVCPSGNDCPYYGGHIKQISLLQEQVSHLTTITEAEAQAFARWCVEEERLPPPQDIVTLTSNINSLEGRAKLIEKELNNIGVSQKELSLLETGILNLKEEIAKKTAYIDDLAGQKTELETASTQFEKALVIKMLLEVTQEEKLLNEKLTRSYTTVEGIIRDEVEAAEIKDKINVYDKEIDMISQNCRKLELVKDAFSSKGIETLVIDWILPKLEDRINDVLSKLSDFRVRLDTQKKSTDGESIVEGLFITIINTSGDELAFENYSGGEKLKISVAISEALATLQKVGFRLFDEIFVGLDDNSTESFAEVLQGLQKNFNQVLCISHLLQIKELFDKRINIVKNNNISYAKL